MRRLLQSDHSLSHIAIALMLVGAIGCGNGHGGKPASTAYSVTEQLSAERDLTTEERNIATRICYAYKSKGSNLKTMNYVGRTFSFAIDNLDCSSTKKNFIVDGVLTLDETLFYKTTSTAPFQSKVQTDESGYISKLCTKIQNNQVINNTVTEANVKVQIKFMKDTNTDNYILQYFTLAKDNTMTISSSETFKVRTQFNISTGQILGMDEVYQKNVTCSGGKSYSEMMQTFKGITK